MKYYFKPNKELIRFFPIFLIYVVLAVLNVFSPTAYGKLNKDHFYLYFLIFVVAAFLGRIIIRLEYILLILRGKPLLEVNEIYIFDCTNSIKYYWDDIDEIEESGGVLYVKTFDSDKYLKKFNGFFNRPLYYSKKGKCFKIDLSCVKPDVKILVETLNEYSIKALEIERREKNKAAF